MPKKVKPFPKTLYVVLEEDSNDPDGGFFSCDEEPKAEDGQRIAVYERREIRTMKITKELT